MGVSSTEKSRLRRQRIRDGRRLIKTWLDADQIDALADYGLVGSVETVDTAELNEVVQILMRGLVRRGVAFDLEWHACDALARSDRARSDRMVARATEREQLLDYRRSMFGRPKSRAALNIEIQPA